MKTAKKQAADAVRVAYSYLRFSSAEQRKGDSKRRQTTTAAKACGEFGWLLSDTTFRDEGRSAFRGGNAKTGNLGRFLEMMAAKRIERNAVLILEDFDRLSRDKMMASLDLVRQILEGGCDIFCCLNWKLYTRADLDSPMTLVEMLWRFHLAHEESAKKSYRSAANWAAKQAKAKEKGEIIVANCPAWLTVREVGGKRKFMPIPERVKVVRQIFRWCADGKGIHSIMTELCSGNVPPFRSGWNQKYIHCLLTDRRVLGEHECFRYDGETSTKVKTGDVIKGYYPAVVDDGLYYAANNAMRARKVATRGRKSHQGKNLFQGLVHFAEHDCSMVYLYKPRTWKGKVHHHSYLASIEGWKGHKPYFAIPYEGFEEAVLAWLIELSPSDFTDDGGNGDELTALQEELKFTEDRSNEIAGSLSEQGISVRAVVQALADMQAKKSEISRKIEEYIQKKTTPGFEEVPELVDVLRKASPDEAQSLREKIRQRLLFFIKRIVVERDTAPGAEPGDVVVWIEFQGEENDVRQIMYNTKKPQDGYWMCDDGK